MVEISTGSRSLSIGTSAAIVGGLSLAAGFVGPALFSDSNLGPLLGVFVTGPLGVLAGALAGVVLSARGRPGRSRTPELRWLAACWIAALLFTLALSTGGIGWLALGAQLAVVLCTGVLFLAMPDGLPPAVRRWRLLILAGLGLALLVSIFPPTLSRGGGTSQVRLFLDSGFDASTRVPDLIVDQTVLLAEWLLIMSFVALIVFIDQARRRTEADSGAR